MDYVIGAIQILIPIDKQAGYVALPQLRQKC